MLHQLSQPIYCELFLVNVSARAGLGWKKIPLAFLFLESAFATSVTYGMLPTSIHMLTAGLKVLLIAKANNAKRKAYSQMLHTPY